MAGCNGVVCFSFGPTLPSPDAELFRYCGRFMNSIFDWIEPELTTDASKQDVSVLSKIWATSIRPFHQKHNIPIRTYK
ncbi:uncharacterized protein YALI1_B06635g [Yarrowia lipolytica]|uniref:Uncharacterized protein n=1 Tax=Yarrowia lipolytica TaxID=4952 RepID=A0A1D8N6I1_YARLL|nr:hypothetical protein YALI1_B06635g [Yarrowia lipolytica]